MKDFNFLNKNANSNPLIYHINRAGIGRVNSDFYIKRNKSYPYCVFHYVMSGRGFVVFRGKKFAIEQGQLFILNAYEPHEYWTESEKPLSVSWIEFSGGDSSRLVESIIDNVSPIINSPYSNKEYKYMIRILNLLQRNPENKAVLISKLLYSLLLGLVELEKNKRYSEVSRSGIDAVTVVINYINDNLASELTIHQLAKVANYNVTYFSKFFLKVTGVTPAKYVINKRIAKAKELLISEEKSMDLLAEVLGFCNASHFIRQFKKAEGMTPAEFRKQSLLYRNGNL